LERMTTTTLEPDRIHQIGLEAVDRIHAQMREIMHRVKFQGSLQEFFDHMRTSPQFYHPETQEGRAEYLREATALIDAMENKLPQLFATLPQAQLVVKAVEPFREQSAGKAFYQRPSPDGSRPGTYYVNLYR